MKELIKDNIRLMIYIADYWPLFSGYVYHLQLLLPLLKKYNIEPWILAHKYPGLKSEEVVNGVLVRRIKIPKLFKIKATISELYLLPFFFRYRKEFDLALTITDGPACPILMKICDKPLIRPIAISEDFSEKFRGISGSLKKISFWYADHIIAISPATEKNYYDINWPMNKITLIPHGVDTNIFKPADSMEAVIKLRSKLGLPLAPNKLFLTVGAIEPRKGQDKLIEAWHHISEANKSVYLVIIGPVLNKAYYNNLLVKIEKYELKKQIIFVGRSEKVSEYMRCADGFVFTSKREGFGIVIIEAMSSELPVVAFTIKDILPFIINRTETGILVEQGDSKALAEEVLKIASDADLQSKIGKAARIEVFERFSLYKEAEAHAKLYWQVFQQQSKKK